VLFVDSISFNVNGFVVRQIFQLQLFPVMLIVWLSDLVVVVVVVVAVAVAVVVVVVVIVVIVVVAEAFIRRRKQKSLSADLALGI